jgi:hypothetical protein
MVTQPQLIVSISEARKLLGKEARDLTDAEVEEIIIVLTGIASRFLRRVEVPKNKQVLSPLG